MSRALVLAAVLVAGAAVVAQTSEFTVRPVPGRPGIDGRAWMFVELYTGSPAVVHPSGSNYELRFTDRKDENGGPRWTVTLDRGGRQVPLTPTAKTSFVYITPDAKYAIVEPLTVIETATGQRHELNAGPGMKIVAVAQDGKRLFLERADGEPYELTLP